jgi:hypothetical protein
VEHWLKAFKKSVLRIFLPKVYAMVEGWRRLQNEELQHNAYSSPKIIRMIKSGRMRWAGKVARMRETKNIYSRTWL